MSGYFDSMNRRTRKVSVLTPRDATIPADRPVPTPPQAGPPAVIPPQALPPQVLPPATPPAPSVPASRPALDLGPQVTIVPNQQQYTALRERLLAMAPAKPLKALVFAGCNGGEGCTQVVREFAQTLAASGLRVLLVDADARSSGLTHAMAATGTDLSALVNQNGGLAPATDYGRGQLTVVPSPASANDKEKFFTTPEFSAWLDAQRGSYDYVLLDAPPLLRFADGLLMGRVSDGVVILAQAETTERDALTRARDVLRKGSVNGLGVVLNRVRNPVPLSLRPYLTVE
jgi:Mrp family chromosome partitioning ATPase